MAEQLTLALIYVCKIYCFKYSDVFLILLFVKQILSSCMVNSKMNYDDVCKFVFS